MNQTVRLFVSSTFRDMQAERDVLARHCFPAARRQFAQAGVGFVEIDLRWGLQLGESEERIVQLCLQEVDRCRGHFVGILGARYGYVPGQRPPSPDAASVDWPETASITEYEIRAGAFAQPPPKFVRFYFKSSGDDAEDPQQARLKQEISTRGFTVRHYATPEALSALLLDDLSALADEQAAATESPAQRGQRQLDMLCHAAVPRPALDAALDAWAASTKQRLHVTSPAGFGKTTLLATWVRRARLKAGAQAVQPATASWRSRLAGWLAPAAPAGDGWLVHWAGAKAGDNRFGDMLVSLLEQMGHDPALQPPIAHSLSTRLAHWQQALTGFCAQHRQVFLVVDGVDDLNLDPVLPLHWLPTDLPNLRVVLAGQDCGVLAAQPGPGAPTLQVAALPPTHRLQALNTYLQGFGKALPPGLGEHLAAGEALSSAAALRWLADELRLTGTPEHLAERARALARLPCAAALADDVLARLEAENGTALVADLCGLLLVSRGGLLEDELRSMLGTRHTLAAWRWSSLMQGFRRSVFDHQGRLAVYDHSFAAAIRARHLPTPASVQARRDMLVAHFQTLAQAAAQAHATPSRRVVDELPWQLRAAGDSQALLALLSGARFMTACWHAEPDAALAHWQFLFDHCGVGCLQRASAAWLDDLAAGAAEAAPLALMLAALGRVDDALHTGRVLLQRAAGADGADGAHGAQGAQGADGADGAGGSGGFSAPLRRRADVLTMAALLVDAQRADDAGAWLDAASRCHADPLPAALQAAELNTQGSWHLAQGRCGEALAAFTACEALHQARGDVLAVAHSRHNQALALARSNKPGAARRLLQDCAADFERLHDMPALIDTDINSAQVEEHDKRLQAALRKLERPERLARDTQDWLRLAQVLSARARVVEALDDRDGAERAQRERQQLLARLGDVDGELDALMARVSIRLNLGPRALANANELLEEAQRRAADGAAPSAQTLARLAALQARIAKHRPGVR